MKVLAFIKIRKHPQPDSGGAQAGDIISFHPVDEPRSEEELKFYLPILVDINIPCGEKYDKGLKCVNCEFNDPDLCDNIKYTRGIWGEGSLLTPPKPITKRKYKIDRTKFISGATDETVLKWDKTEVERQTILSDSLAHEQPKSVIELKTFEGEQKLKYG